MVEIVDGVRTTGNISSVDLPELNVTDTLGVLSPSDIFTFVDRHMENASVKTLKYVLRESARILHELKESLSVL